MRDGVAVVVSPLIALMQDQVAALRELGVPAAYLNSTLTAQEAATVESQVRRGELKLLYVAPERLLTERCLALLHQARLGLIAIDEAHCVSQWGTTSGPNTSASAAWPTSFRRCHALRSPPRPTISPGRKSSPG